MRIQHSCLLRLDHMPIIPLLAVDTPVPGGSQASNRRLTPPNDRPGMNCDLITTELCSWRGLMGGGATNWMATKPLTCGRRRASDAAGTNLKGVRGLVSGSGECRRVAGAPAGAGRHSSAPVGRRFTAPPARPANRLQPRLVTGRRRKNARSSRNC